MQQEERKAARKREERDARIAARKASQVRVVEYGRPHPDSPPEQKLWTLAQNGRLRGARFNIPIGPYIVDMVFVKARLVVEIDGKKWHGSVEARERDARRDAWFRENEVEVMRVAARDVMKNAWGVAAMIEQRVMMREWGMGE